MTPSWRTPPSQLPPFSLSSWDLQASDSQQNCKTTFQLVIFFSSSSSSSSSSSTASSLQQLPSSSPSTELRSMTELQKLHSCCWWFLLLLLLLILLQCNSCLPLLSPQNSFSTRELESYIPAAGVFFFCFLFSLSREFLQNISANLQLGGRSPTADPCWLISSSAFFFYVIQLAPVPLLSPKKFLQNHVWVWDRLGYQSFSSTSCCCVVLHAAESKLVSNHPHVVAGW